MKIVLKLTNEIISKVKEDAINYGSALNEADWEFDKEYSKVMKAPTEAKLFNNCKSILRKAIIKYLDTLQEEE